ncbi:hypothetical protein FACS189419_04920 [Planctomycetales bacterium]|nr:hypothetical protein FACS189419_04920 [Planctomycetales bacterium]
MNREQWLENRKYGIGGSDAAAILGLNLWKTNQDVFDEKTGIAQSDDLSDNAAVQYGIAAEPVLRGLFAVKHPELLVEGKEYLLWRNEQYPFLLGTLDGLLTDKSAKGRFGVLEIKTAVCNNRLAFDKWREQVPQQYYIQVLHYLLVTGFDFAVLFAELRNELTCNSELREYHWERADVEADIETLLEKEIEFWTKHVQKNLRPALILPEI